MSRLTKSHAGVISLLIGSWLAVYLITRYWGVLNYSLTILITDKGIPVSLVYFLPFCCCVIFGIVLAGLFSSRKNRPGKNNMPKPVIALRTIVWAVPALVFALWHTMYLFIDFIPRPFVYDATSHLDFEICCGIIVGIAIGSIRNTAIDNAEGSRVWFSIAFKTVFCSAVYFVIFCLFSVWLQARIYSVYGYADYGLGAYWITAGIVILFGFLFGLFFRLPWFSSRGIWTYRSGGMLIWVIILIVLIIFMGVAWELFTKVYMPSFPSPKGRIPDIAVIWMLALGYIIGNNIERAEYNAEDTLR